MELTTEQNAILKRSGSMVVIANAGTGKTTMLVEMVKKELPLLKEGQRIICITFTNMAADDIKSRIGETVSVLATTIDSFLISLINELLDFADEGFNVRPAYGIVFDTYREGVELMKNQNLIGVFRNHENNFACQVLKHVLERYPEIGEYVAERYPLFCIDEYQDTDKDMHTLFMWLHDKLGIRLFLIGDPKQSLYGWRGAHPEYMVELTRRKDFSCKRLTKNFRSTPDIVSYSNMLFGSAAVPANRNINPRDIIFLPIIDFWAWGRDAVSCFDLDKQITLLRYKNRDVSDDTIELNRAGLPCQRIYRPAIFNMEIENKAFYLALAKFTIDETTNFDTFIGQLGYKPTEMVDLSNMKEYAHNLRRAASMSEFYEAVKALADFLDIETDYNALTILYDTIENSDGRAYFLQDQYQYKAMTIHSAKGLEWDQILIFAEDFPLDSIENRCLYYVAVTRAKQRVVILCRNYDDAQRLKHILPYNMFS